MSNQKKINLIGLVSMIAGIGMIVAGVVTWGFVRAELKAESIVVAEDASMFAGWEVTGPLTAYSQAEIIKEHALDMSDGKTYAELDREDPTRDTMMNASFLRASLFTSVVSFGLAAFAMLLGVLFTGMGWALRTMTDDDDDDDTPAKTTAGAGLTADA